MTGIKEYILNQLINEEKCLSANIDESRISQSEIDSTNGTIIGYINILDHFFPGWKREK